MKVVQKILIYMKFYKKSKFDPALNKNVTWLKILLIILIANKLFFTFSENIQKLSNLFLDRPMSALNTSVYWVEYVAKHKNILQSPALDLYWWQLCLLDVYAFILAVIITVLYIALFILRKLKKLLFGSRTCAKKDNAAMKSKKNK